MTVDSSPLHGTVWVADTSDPARIAALTLPVQDATTNPSLVLKTLQQPAYQSWLTQAVQAASAATPGGANTDAVMDALLVRFAQALLAVIPGRVSVELDARLSFDTQATVDKAERLLQHMDAAGVPRHRVLLKIAATWEGIQAARVLSQQGVATNMTLVFNMAQATACADAGVTLISPFVGRIYDYVKAQAGAAWDEAAHTGVHDPGVQSVTAIYQTFKHHGVRTHVMGASFRQLGQVLALAGCDLLTVSPELLDQLAKHSEPVTQVLQARHTPHAWLTWPTPHETAFRDALAADSMARTKLQEGIDAFVRDTDTLRAMIEAQRVA